MAKRSGRKVYRNSVSAKKKRAKKIVNFIITLIVFAVLVFIGYSVAKPIYNYFSFESENNEPILPWTPPVSEESSTIIIKMDEEFMVLLEKLHVNKNSIPSLLDYYESVDEITFFTAL